MTNTRAHLRLILRKIEELHKEVKALYERTEPKKKAVEVSPLKVVVDSLLELPNVEHRLSTRELAFLLDMQGRNSFTPKQETWIKDIREEMEVR